MRTLNYRARFIELASEINSEMPHHVVRKVAEALNERQKSVKGSNILVLGVAYKPDIDDARESPALDVIALLQDAGAIVSYSDPHIASIRVPQGTIDSVRLDEESVTLADCIVLVTNHTNVDYSVIQRSGRPIVDTRNAVAKHQERALR
jgi:UDP-N-acetyl-D-glucosamine dehydrogenase